MSTCRPLVTIKQQSKGWVKIRHSCYNGQNLVLKQHYFISKVMHVTWSTWKRKLFGKVEDYKSNLYIFITFYRFVWKYKTYQKNSGTRTFIRSKYQFFLRTMTFIKNLVPGTLLSKILTTYRYKVALCSH